MKVFASRKLGGVGMEKGRAEIVRLWEGAGAPDSRIAWYPAQGAGPRACVIVCPGGGYGMLAPHEGEPVALWLNSLGISAGVLTYRVAPHRHPAPLADAQRAVRLVRHFSGNWDIDAGRVGILGFSAGGHLAATAATQFDEGDARAADVVDRQSSRPDLAILGYPVISFEQFYHGGSRENLLGPNPAAGDVQDLSAERRVTANSSPSFIWFTADDEAVDVRNGLLFASALREHGVPFELHVYEHGRHGLGLAEGDAYASAWTAACAAWLRNRGFAGR
jgi:acetyl esterase/lipase